MIYNTYIVNLCLLRLFLFFILAAGIASASQAHAATLSLSPNAGTFEVGGTFSVSVALDSKDISVNAFTVELQFPPDMLQIVSPTTGKSIVEAWVKQPTYDNQKGIIQFQGGIPGGIKTDYGVISTLTFRPRKTGRSIVRFTDASEVFANDGKASPVLSDVLNGIYTITLPPPKGPTVVSETFPDQSRFYSETNALFIWANESPADGYSFMLSENPVDIPDDIVEGGQQSMHYSNLTSGTRYFHIKALRDGRWGGITHFAINADVDPPAEFDIDIEPDHITTAKSVVARWTTTDSASGVDHYEYKIINVSGSGIAEAEEQTIFIEADSPQVLALDRGEHDIIVRAYDKAGNIREETSRIRIVTPFEMAVRNIWTWILLALVVGILSFIALRTHGWHKLIHEAHFEKRLPDRIRDDLEELKKYRTTYGKMSMLFFVAGIALLFGYMFAVAHAESTIAPPIVTSTSRNIANEEIFYIGGKTDNALSSVIIYLQDTQSGSVRTFGVVSDKKGDWFYRHDSFLPSGRYILWAQANVGEQFSPPTPQIQMDVRRTALQFGTSRISYETLSVFLMLILFAVNIGLVLFIVFYVRQGRRKRRAWFLEVREAEESLKRGFAVVRHDIGKELEIINQVKKSKALSGEERRREEQLMRDLNWAEKYIGKEIWDIEKEAR